MPNDMEVLWLKKEDGVFVKKTAKSFKIVIYDIKKLPKPHWAPDAPDCQREFFITQGKGAPFKMVRKDEPEPTPQEDTTNEQDENDFF